MLMELLEAPLKRNHSTVYAVGDIQLWLNVVIKPASVVLFSKGNSEGNTEYNSAFGLSFDLFPSQHVSPMFLDRVFEIFN